MLTKAVQIIDRLFLPSTSPAARPARAGSSPELERLRTVRPSLRRVIVEEPDSPEVRAVVHAIRTEGLPFIVTHAPGPTFNRFSAELRLGTCLPVGSIGFVQACMALAGIPPPQWSCYPRPLAKHLLQAPHCITAGAALQAGTPTFIKPVMGKSFAGFVLRPYSELDDRAREQLVALSRLDPATPVWAAHALTLCSEWRYYVLSGDVIGFGCYARSGGDPAVHPPLEEIGTIVAAVPNDAAYALDVGVLASGELTLVALRDAWALDLVGGGAHAPLPLDYLKLLWMRWVKLLLDSARLQREPPERNT